jgi:type IV secretory pathway VirB10-like protein
MASMEDLRKGNLTPAVNYVKIALIFIVISVTASMGVIGFILSYNKINDNKASEAIELVSSYVPENYFYSKDHFSSSTVVNQSRSAAPVIPVSKPAEIPSIELNVIPVTKPMNIAPPLTAEEAFLRDQLSKMELIEEMRDQKMAERKTASKTNEWQSSSVVEELKKSDKNQELKDKDFSEQEIGKDISTFPVDLSRTITADRSIPCILVDEINSMIEGRAICSVESNVFGYHGRFILIPAGSRLIGSHGTLEKVGDERFNIAWTRLIRPDGVHIKLTEAYAADRIGSTGIGGKINNRRWEKYGAAILTATVSAITQLSIPSESNNVTNTVVQSYGTDLGRVTAATLQETINIKPYAIVKAGTRILVTPTTDIWLKETGSHLSFDAVKK